MSADSTGTFSRYKLPWQVTLRESAWRLCDDFHCILSGGLAHAGPCKPCKCPDKHAIVECPLNHGKAIAGCQELDNFDRSLLWDACEARAQDMRDRLPDAQTQEARHALEEKASRLDELAMRFMRSIDSESRDDVVPGRVFEE